jgi:hypothetical protein
MENHGPKLLEDLGFNFKINFQKLWKLELPVTELDIEELIWHFDIPFWEKDDTDDWNLTPWEVIKKTEGSKDHQKKIDNANLDYPLDIMRNNNRWPVLDGLHRLAKAYQLGYKKLKYVFYLKKKLRK